MHFYQNKKSMVKGFIIGVLLLTAGFLLIISIWDMIKSKAEAKTAEAICKGSIAFREKSYTEVKLKGLKLTDVATPQFCRTIDKYVPEDKDATKEDIEREIAGLMATCWSTYGEGLIPDVFKEGNTGTKNCQACYTVNLRETSKFKGEIKSAELLQYMTQNPYKISPEGDYCRSNGGFCISSENKEDCRDKLRADPSYILLEKKDSTCKKSGTSSCCYTDYGCWNKGGICSGANPDANLYVEYNQNQWDCPSKMKCFAKKENYYSYYEYIRSFGGPGDIYILTDLKPGDTYAISFGSPTGQCGWCTQWGIGAGAGAALGVGGAIAVGAISGVGWIPLAGIGAYALVKGGSEKVVKDFSQFFERDTNTIYLTTLNQLQSGQVGADYCNIIKDVRET